MLFTFINSRAWLCIFWVVELGQAVYCGRKGKAVKTSSSPGVDKSPNRKRHHAGAAQNSYTKALLFGGASMEDFRKVTDGIFSRVEKWDGKYIMSLLNHENGGKAFIKDIICSLVNSAYLRYAFESEGPRITALQFLLKDIGGQDLGFDDAVEKTNSALGEYYSFMVTTFESFLSKYLSRLAGGLEFPEFEKIATLSPDEFNRLSNALNGTSDLFVMLDADAVDKSTLFSTHVERFMDLVIGQYKLVNAEVRDAARNIEPLTANLSYLDEKIRACKKGSDDMLKLKIWRANTERIVMKKIIDIDNVIKREDISKYKNLHPKFYISLQTIFRRSFNRKMTAELVLPLTNAMGLAHAMRKNLLAFVKYARKRVRASDSTAKRWIGDDIKFVRDFESSGLRAFHSKIVEYGKIFREFMHRAIPNGFKDVAS